MNSKLQNASIFAILILCAVSAFGQTEGEIADKFGKPIKVYSVDDTILMSVKSEIDALRRLSAFS